MIRRLVPEGTATRIRALRTQTLYPLQRERHVRRLLGGPDPIIVYTLGKTGSTAVIRALEQVTDRPVIQVHHASTRRLALAEARYRSTAPHAHPHHHWNGHVLARRPARADHPWDVVTIVREPMANHISAFFQAGARLGHVDPSAAATPAEIEQLIGTFLRVHDRRRAPHWFDRELIPVTGVDVYAVPFDHEAGSVVVEREHVRVLVLRNESLVQAPGALSDFLGLEVPAPLPRDNDAAAKDYQALYDAFVSRVRPPADLLDALYGSRYARHFYSAAEISSCRHRWAGRT